MTEPKTFMGIPIHTAKPEELRAAVMLGRQIHSSPEYAFYDYGGKIFVIDRANPPETK